MERNRYSYQRRPRSRDTLERQMDQWVSTGRQFVDGVAGNRPGQRRKDNNRYGLNNMGRWVEDKIDWFFEEEEEEWLNTHRVSQMKIEDNVSTTKRPLTAISLRVPKVLSPSSQVNNESDLAEEWIDEKTFKIDRWERERSQKSQFNDTQGFVEASILCSFF